MEMKRDVVERWVCFDVNYKDRTGKALKMT